MSPTCRFYKAKLPKEREVVMIKVKRVLEFGAYVDLLEYNNAEGLIHMIDISKKYVPNIRKCIRVGSEEPAVVTEVQQDKGFVELSILQVSEDDAHYCREQFSKAKAINSVLTHVARLLGYTSDEQLEQLYAQTAWHFDEKYQRKNSAFDIFESAAKEPSLLEDCGLDDNSNSVLLSTIQQKLTAKNVEIRAEIDVRCYKSEGIEAVKRALIVGKQCSKHGMTVKINLNKCSVYRVTTDTTEPELGVAMLQESMKIIEESILSSGGMFTVVQPPKVTKPIKN